jgi:RNA polymerase sigma factor (sigma-70 family)
MMQAPPTWTASPADPDSPCPALPGPIPGGHAPFGAGSKPEDRRARLRQAAASVVAFCRAGPGGVSVISTEEVPVAPCPVEPAAPAGRSASPPHGLLDGDFDAFYAEYDPLIRRMVASHHVARSDADDCAQEIWAEILKSLPRLEYDPSRGPLEAWLFTLVRRKIWNFKRSQARDRVARLSDPDRSVRSPEPDPAAALERRERSRLVREALRRVRPRVSATNYRILELRWVEGQSPAEIAAHVGLPAHRVRYRLSRMKPKLRALLSPRAGSGRFPK